jgi:hypothetical protein
VHIPPGDSPHEMPPGLAPFQVEVARLFFALRASHGFPLAGGAALLAQRLTDRPTRDLDFFHRPRPRRPPRRRGRVRGRARDRGWRIETLQSGAMFVRLLIGRRDEQLLVDLAVDAPPGRPATITIVGPSYDPAELAGRKVIVKGRGLQCPCRMRLRAVRAVVSAVGRVWRYFSVVVMDWWPSRSRTTCRPAPPASSQEAWEWRRSCMRGRGCRSAESQVGYQIWVRQWLRGRCPSVSGPRRVPRGWSRPDSRRWAR